MKIAFCCSCLEPGRDGVGDYTRRLAAELTSRGHPCFVVALNDSYVPEAASEVQAVGDVSIPVLRLPEAMAWGQRVVWARNWLAGHHPDWLSLQFVPFGFHPRGLCFGLGKALAALAPRASWHVMFHELWLGLGRQSSVKARVWGGLQRGIVLDLLQCLQPKVVHTQADPYRLTLAQLKIDAQILPLFSNIPLIPGDGWDELLEPLVAGAAGARQARSQLYLAGILGAVHSEWNAADAVNALLPLVNRAKKRLVLVFHGKNNLSPEAIQKLQLDFQDRALVVTTGERSSREISKILQSLDLGLATTPLQAIQKSGSTVAMLEHGLSVLVIRDDWRLRGAAPAPADPRLFTPQQFAALNTLPAREIVSPADTGLKHVAAQLVNSLTAATHRQPASPSTVVPSAPLVNRVS